MDNSTVNRTDSKLKYSELVDILKDRNSISKHRANTVTKEYSECLKNKLKEGYDIEIPSIFDVRYVGKKVDILENKKYTFKNQVKDVSENLGYSPIDVRTILLDYLKLIKIKVEQGNQINLKSIGYIIPYEDSEGRGYIERFSPVLELADSITAVTMDENGNNGVSKLDKEDIYIKMFCSEDLEQPVFKTKDFKFKTIDL